MFPRPLLVLVALSLAACNSQTERLSVTDGPITVTVDPAIHQEDTGEGVGVVLYGPFPRYFLLEQLIINLGDDETTWQTKLESVLEAYNTELLEDYSPVPPPPEIPGDDLRDIPVSPFRLIGLTPPEVSLEALARRLEGLGYRGTITFSNREAADLYDVLLSLNENELGLGVEAELNVLEFITSSLRGPR